MRKPRNILALAGSLVALGAPAAAGAAAMPVPGDVTAAATALVTDEVAAWNRGDATAFAAHTTDDVVFTNIVGMFSVGRAPFVAQHARIFATIYKGSTMAQRIEHIALVCSDVAIVDTVATLTGFVALPPGNEAVDGALHTRLEQVLVRNGGIWSVASFHNVAINARATAAPPK